MSVLVTLQGVPNDGIFAKGSSLNSHSCAGSRVAESREGEGGSKCSTTPVWTIQFFFTMPLLVDVCSALSCSCYFKVLHFKF